jgi:ADP-ribosyl-[dinitrogen reductase] hydrolase
MSKTAEILEDRALGCLIGALVGDAAGATLEFLERKPTSIEIEQAMTLPGGGILNLAPGQITDDGELTLCLAQALSESTTFDIEKIAQFYAKWIDSSPFDVGFTTSKSLGCFDNSKQSEQMCQEQGYAIAMTTAASQLSMDSKANGSLMRITPLGIWGHKLDDQTLARYAQQDSQLSHPNPSCCHAVACYCIAIANLLRQPGDRQNALDKVELWAKDHANQEVLSWLKMAKANIDIPYHPQIGFIKIAFTHAFRHLYNGSDYVSALRETLAGGGDTDTNACIVGGLMGAVSGLKSIPESMVEGVLNCDTNQGKHPRPRFLQSNQVPALVKQLL